MHWRGGQVGAIALLLAAPAFASDANAAPAWPTPAPVTTTLANGLRVIVAEDHRLPIVGMTLRYGVGAATEPSGLAARLAPPAPPPALIRESKHVGKDVYELSLLNVGARDVRWSIGRDAMRFYLTVPAAQANLPLWLWSDQMGFPEHAIRDVIAAPSGLAEQRRARAVDDVAYGRSEPAGERAGGIPRQLVRPAECNAGGGRRCRPCADERAN